MQNRMIAVSERRYKELCADYLEVKSKYKQALETIKELIEKYEKKSKRTKKEGG